MRATILCGLLAGVLAGTVQSAPINGTYNTILDDGSGNVQVSNANGCGTVAFSNGVGTTLLGNNVCRQFSNAIDRMWVRHGCTCMTSNIGGCNLSNGWSGWFVGAVDAKPRDNYSHSTFAVPMAPKRG